MAIARFSAHLIDKWEEFSEKPFFFPLLLILFAFILRLPFAALSVVDWDETAYTLVAREILQGHWPFETAFDHKPVGIYLHFALAMFIGGDNPVSTRLLGAVCVALSSAALFQVLVSQIRVPRCIAAVLAASYILACYGMWGATTNSEHLINLYSLLWLWCLLVTGPARRKLLILGGFLVGMSFQVNYLTAPIFGLAIIGYAGSELLRRDDAAPTFLALVVDGVMMAIGFVAANAFILGLLAHYGDIGQYFALQSAFLSGYKPDSPFVETLGALSGNLRILLPIFGLIAIMAVQYFRQPATAPKPAAQRGRRISTVALIIGLLAGSTFAALTSGRYYAHYFLFLMPAIFLLIGVLMEQYIGRGRELGLALGMTVISATVIGGDGFWHAMRGSLTFAQLMKGAETSADTPRVDAMRMKPYVTADRPIYVVCAEPVTYQLLNKTAPTRFGFWIHHLDPLDAGALGFTVESEVKRVFEKSPSPVLIGNVCQERGWEYGEGVVLRALQQNGYKLAESDDKRRIFIK